MPVTVNQSENFHLPDYILIKTFLKNNNKQNVVSQRDEYFAYLAAQHRYLTVPNFSFTYAYREFRSNIPYRKIKGKKIIITTALF